MNISKEQSMGSYISSFYRLGASFLSKEYKDYGIGSGQYQFLFSLYLEDGVSHDKLTEKMSVDKATTTRAIMKLEEEGYVKRVLDENDKRKYKIFLTDKAVEKKEEILNIGSKWEQQLIGCLEPEEFKSLEEIFKKISKNQDKYKQEKHCKNKNVDID